MLPWHLRNLSLLRLVNVYGGDKRGLPSKLRCIAEGFIAFLSELEGVEKKHLVRVRQAVGVAREEVCCKFAATGLFEFRVAWLARQQ